MNIELEKSTTTEGLIKISLKEPDYQSKYEEKIKSYSKQANIKGFRPGKVPTSLIKKMYGKSILVEEINKILVDSLNKYIKDNDIKIIGDPLPNNEKALEIDWDEQKEFDFEYEIGLVSDFKYDINFKVNKYDIKVEKKEIDKIVENLKSQYGEMTNPDESEESDSIFGTLSQSETEFNIDTVLDLKKTKKKLVKKFIGFKKDDELTIDIKALFDNDDELSQFTQKTPDEVKDLKGDFQFKVKNINRVVPAEMNQEFFDKVFGKDNVDSEEKFIEKYKEILKENYEKESGYLLSRDVQLKLLENVKIEIPEGFYRKWLLTANKGLTEEELDKDFDHYIKDLKWTLIKNRISEDHEIKVENDEVVSNAKGFIKEQYGLFEVNEEMEKNLEVIANNYLQQNNGEHYMKIYNQVHTEKIMDLVKQNAAINVKKVGREEFNKKVEN